MAEISGWVSGLEDRIISLEGQILALPTNSDLATYTNLINGRLNTLEATSVTMNSNITLLLQSFSNLKDTILNIDAILISHTGLATGDGVHGH